MNKVPAKASDPNDLERHVLDPNIAKSEAEWWAKNRIEELERERDGWKASAENRLEIQRQREERIAALLSDNARLREALENIEMRATKEPE